MSSTTTAYRRRCPDSLSSIRSLGSTAITCPIFVGSSRPPLRISCQFWLLTRGVVVIFHVSHSNLKENGEHVVRARWLAVFWAFPCFACAASGLVRNNHGSTVCVRTKTPPDGEWERRLGRRYFTARKSSVSCPGEAVTFSNVGMCSDWVTRCCRGLAENSWKHVTCNKSKTRKTW